MFNKKLSKISQPREESDNVNIDDETLLSADITKEADIDKFVDKEGLSVKKMEFGVWFVSYRILLFLLLLLFIALLAVFFWSKSFFVFGKYVFHGIKAEYLMQSELLSKNFIDHGYFVSKQPENLQQYPTQLLLTTNNNFDLVSQIRNPNKEYWAEFDYYFTNGELIVGKDDGFILPQDTKHLLALGQNMIGQLTGLKLVLENIKWHRVNEHQFGIWEEFEKTHLDMPIRNVSYVPGSRSKLTEKISLNDLGFTITNNTAYNYWNIKLIMLLYSYKDIVGVNTHLINDFKSDEVRKVQITWPGAFPKITDIKIVPDLNITKNDIYFDFEGQPDIFEWQ